ncbi:MAG: DHH family phosphoesterase, partial [Patescibacteria group bacterium]
MTPTQMQNWKLSEPISEDIQAKFPDLNPVILQLLWNRGLQTQKDMDLFLRLDYNNLHDPFLFRDMSKLIERLRQALAKQETVFIYGDYDTDGVSSSVLMAEALRAIGIKNVFVYLPHRDKEGYGLNKEAIDYIAGQSAHLIITVDCGSSNVEEVAYIKTKGLDVIIIDHHEEPPQLPQGLTAFLNPHISGETYPFKDLAAVGVSFKVVQAIWQSFDLPAGHEKWFLDLTAIATVADMMPLVDENRIFVSFGLKVLNKTKRLGLAAMIKSLGTTGPLGVYDIGFKIGPRLNAAGRIDHANAAYELLVEKDEAKATDFAQALNNTNTDRQIETERILQAAMDQVAEQAKDKLVLMAVGEDWQVGVVGLVSGRITEKFTRPSLV